MIGYLIGWLSKPARELLRWAHEEKNQVKKSNLLFVATKIERRKIRYLNKGTI